MQNPDPAETDRIYSLIGAGGTGSFLYPALLRYLENYHGNRNEQFVIQVIDGDHFTADNHERQLFEGRYVDENKANAIVAQHASRHGLAIAEYLGDTNIDDLIRDGDTVIIAADNYPVRSKIESHGKTLENLTVLNGGNEKFDGSCQVWVRRDGLNITPPMSHMHDEIHRPGVDRAAIDCIEAAALPGGEQTIIANLMSATTLLNALRHAHEWEDKDPSEIPFHEIFFDLNTAKMRTADWRKIGNWQ